MDQLLAAYHDTRTVSRDVLAHVVLPVLIVTALGIYPTYALYAKRWHDRGESGWWSRPGLVPITAIWVVIELGFPGGDESQNAYGSR